MAGDTPSQVAKRYGITRKCVYDMAYGTNRKRVGPVKKLVEALGYDSKLPHYKKRNGDVSRPKP